MTVAEKEQQVIEDFAIYDDWLDKYEYIIELGKSLTGYPEELKTEDHLIRGCQSRVWLDASLQDGVMRLRADSDAIITKGIISLLISVFDGAAPQEILDSGFGFVEKIGLKENLSPTRSNGLVSMIARLKELAAAAV